MLSDFREKLILITGASAGVGWQAARDFAAQGARLMLAARRRDRLENLAREIHSQGAQAEALPCDLSDPWSRDRLITGLLTRNLIPDILINNAGYANSRPFVKETPADVARMMAVNYQAAADLMSAFLPEMIRRGSGAIVNVASTAGRVAMPNLAAYCASKFALCALTEAVSYELAGSGVTIHLVNPGPIDTEFFDAGVWEGLKSRRMASASDVSRAMQDAILHQRLITTVPASRSLLVYLFNVLGPIGRWAVRRRGAR